MRDKILVLDDEANLRKILEATLTREGYEVFCFESFAEAKATLNQEHFDLVLTDLQMPGESGMDVLAYCKNYSPDLPVVLITAFGTIEGAVNALKAGAFDFVLKPFENSELFRIIEKATQSRIRRRREPALEIMSATGVGPVPFPLFGASQSIQRLRSEVDRMAKNDSPLFMTGEVGTGKRNVAYEIHRKSVRARGPLIQINMEAIPEIFQITELFGVEKSASPVHLFTKPGSLELAQGGTLLIEEVGALSIEAQNLLFLALESEFFSRMGGAKRIPIDLRIITTSEHDLSKMATSGRFHEELFYKLSVENILLAPLRDRAEDLETHLIPFFIERACRKKGRAKLDCSKEALSDLLKRPWPGNLAELERTIEQAVNRCQTSVLERFDLMSTE